LFETIKAGQYEFPSPYWDDVSDMAKDLISNCLKVNPKERFNADQILNHQWFSGLAPTTSMPQITEQLKQYNAKRRFRKYANVAVATTKFMSVAREARTKQEDVL
jgi:serine/threonine protein kinase